MLTLFFAPGSSSMAPHIALVEAAAAFEPRLVSFANGETRTPQFRALNPEGSVPVLLIDGRPLTEVAAILYYVARAFPEANLMPWGNLEAEARVISWMSFIASSVHPARRQGLEHARQVWAIAELKLGKAEWASVSYSIADIHLFRLFWRFFNSLAPAADEFPNLCRHYHAMLARRAVQRVLETEAAIGYELPG